MALNRSALPPFYWPPGEGEPVDDPPSERTVLGHDEGTFFVADDSGRVVSVAPAVGAERFVNTSERQFLDSLHRLDEAWRTRGVLSEDAALQQAHQLRSEIEAVDPAAFTTPKTGGRWLLEQLEQALL